MAVLTEPACEESPLPEETRVMIGAETAEARERIAAALGKGGVRVSAAEDAAEGELFQSAADSSAIVVLACDVGRPRDLAPLRQMRRLHRDVSVVAVSPRATGTGVRRALDAGADAVVFESELETTLAVAVHAVASGQSVVPRELRATVQRPSFSHRELQVLSCLAQGLTNAQIANRLYLSESTIKSHLTSVFAKFGVHSRREAAGLFLELERKVSTGGVR